MQAIYSSRYIFLFKLTYCHFALHAYFKIHHVYYSVRDRKMLKKMILTHKWHAKHPLAAQYTMLPVSFTNGGSLVDNRAYFVLNPGGTSSLEQTTVPLAAYSSRTVYIFSDLSPSVAVIFVVTRNLVQSSFLIVCLAP